MLFAKSLVFSLSSQEAAVGGLLVDRRNNIMPTGYSLLSTVAFG